MKPYSIEYGKRTGPAQARYRKPAASMKPYSIEYGKGFSAGVTLCAPERFNEAVLNRVRKERARHCATLHPPCASMKPYSIEYGKVGAVLDPVIDEMKFNRVGD